MSATVVIQPTKPATAAAAPAAAPNAATTKPASTLESMLARLSSVTGIVPRVKAASDKKDAVPVITPASKSTAPAASKTGTTTKWAAGTGYGHGSQSDWSPEQVKAAQSKKDSDLLEVVNKLIPEFADVKNSPPMEVVEQSCLVPFLGATLKIDSLTEIERHAELYKQLFTLCQSIAKHPSLARLFLLPACEKKVLSIYARDLGAMAQMVEKAATKAAKAAPATATPAPAPAPAAGAATPAPAPAVELPMTQRILAMTAAVEEATKLAEAEEKKRADVKSTPEKADAKSTPVKADTKTDTKPASVSVGDSVLNALKSLLPGSKSDSKAAATPVSAADIKAGNEYVAALEPFRFDEVEKFNSHKFASSGDANGGSAWVRHLAGEFADLSKSLPITSDSSVFMRVHESKMGQAQMMIIPPSNTPYAGGCFLFDVAFPSSYPDTAPKVNLQTTGGGSHRFNPNLYNCGKVCLSLLGTWGGQAGEGWIAKTSTFLQVAVSIQSLVFCPLPYFNEPGYESSMGTPSGTSSSDAYNADQQQATVKFAMIEMLKNPPLNFEPVVKNHFFLKQKEILAIVEKWAEKNDRVKSQVSTLREELGKLKAIVQPK